MPQGRALRGVSGGQAVAAFCRAGGVVARTRDGHSMVDMPNGETIAVPLHKELKIGLLLHIVRQAGLTSEQFRELLRRG